MNKSFYKNLLDLNGNKVQLGKAVEELVELQLPILWILNKSNKNEKYLREKILEEMSDVLMTFESLKLIFGFSDAEIEDQINWKEAKKEKEIFGAKKEG